MNSSSINLIYKRKHSSTSSEPSPSTVQSQKRQTMNTTPNEVSFQADPTFQKQLLHGGLPSLGQSFTRGPTPGLIPPPSYSGMQLTSTPTSSTPNQLTGTMLPDGDVYRIAMAVKQLMAADLERIVEARVQPLVECVQTLSEENQQLKQKLDDLEMYSRRDCVRIFGVDESNTETDAVVLDIADKLKIPLTKADLPVSHRVGKHSTTKPRAIIARITNYNLRHRIIRESKNLRSMEGLKSVWVNQELTKTRAKLAFECRKLVKEGAAKSTFVWDGKIFIVDKHDKKHRVVTIDDLIKLQDVVG